IRSGPRNPSRSKKRLLKTALRDNYLEKRRDYPTNGREYKYVTTVGEQRVSNIHVHDGVTEAQFVEKREARDATLSMPRLILPSIQVNIRAGHMPPADEQGKVYLKLPINML
ncbi:hypothetical protein FED29_021135, partial [Aeromonas veronii]|nr:hypothetical protein [Aeromonas veronii]